MDSLKLKKTAILGSFVLFLLATLLFVSISALYLADYAMGSHSLHQNPEDSESAGILLGVCAIPLIIMTFVLYAMYRKIAREEKLEDDLVAYLKLYRRISMQTLAKDLNVSISQAESTLLSAIARKKIEAYIDRNTEEIIVKSAIKDARVENIRCPNCGSIVSGIYMIGEAVKCPYCETVFKVEE